MRFCYTMALILAMSGMMLGCGNTENKPPPGAETEVQELEIDIDAGDVVPASEIEAKDDATEKPDVAEAAGGDASAPKE